MKIVVAMKIEPKKPPVQDSQELAPANVPESRGGDEVIANVSMTIVPTK